VVCCDVLAQVLLMVQRTQRELPGYEGPREEATQDKGTLKVSSCQAYDYLLLAALKAQVRQPAGLTMSTDLV
jgi:hypothetical protein